MIWLTWRQFRAQAIVAAAALAVTAVVLAVTGAHLAHLFDTSGITTCHAHGDCGMLANAFVNQAKANTADRILFYGGIAVLYAAPAVIGVFWGAPLVAREIEAGTFRLAWSQSVTRTRWLAVKLAVVGLAAMVTAGLLSLMIGWWASPVDRALGLPAGRDAAFSLNRFSPLLFGARGITPIGYAAFAFALGVTSGVLIRRTIPAMATTLAVFTGTLFAVSQWLRPHLITPLHVTSALSPNLDHIYIGGNGQMTLTGSVNIPGAWATSNQTITQGGQVFTGPAPQVCQSRTASFQACIDSLLRLHLRQSVSYQPASRYWAFQWYEAGIFLALAVALAGFCFWWVGRRRLT